MALPTMPLRCDPQHQALIREMARALRSRPEIENALRNVLRCNASELPSMNLSHIEQTRLN